MAGWSSTTTRITIDGKTYSSVDEMPREARAKYEQLMGMLADRDNNGVPDILEGKNRTGVQISKAVSATRRFVVDGQEYKSLEDVPSSAREALLKAESALPASSMSLLQSTATDSGGFVIRLTWPRIILLAAAVAVIGMIIVSLARP